jgi:flagellar biosynthetic protein FliQ
VTDHAVINIAVQAILLATKLAAPILGVSLAIGLVIGLLQSATQIQEQTLTFVPKLVAVAMVLLIGLPWMTAMTVKYTTELLRRLPSLAS